MKKHWRKLLAASFIVGTLTFAPANFSAVHAEVKMYTAMGVDYGNELESQDIVKLRARDKAIKNAVKQAGVGLKTYSRSVNSELTDDEILTITSNTYELVGEVQYNRVAKQVTDQVILIMWEATVNVNVDDAEVKKWLKRDDKEALIEQTKETQKISAENDKKIEDLRKRADKVTGDKERAKLKAEFDAADKEFLYNQKIEEGNKFYYQSYYEEALNSFNEAIKIDPNAAKAYSCRAKTYQRLGKLEASLNNISKAIELEPKNDGYYQTRAYLYKDLKQYDKALADFNKMIELDPKKSDGYHGRATIYEALNQKEKAVEEYTKAIETDPGKFISYSCRADLYEELGQYEKAIDDLTKMIELNPQTSWNYYRRGMSYYRRAKLYAKINGNDKALADMTESINVETDERNKAAAYDHRGSFYLYTLKIADKAATDYEKAIELYTKVINSSEDNKIVLNCYYFRAGLYKKLLQPDKAIADYTKMIELNPRDYRGYNYRGTLYKDNKEYDKAIADYTKAIELEPGDKWRYRDLGDLYKELKQYNKAIEIYNKMIEINPRDTSGYIRRGNMYEKLEQYGNAIDDFTKIIKLDTNKSDGYFWRAGVYQKLKQYDKAIADYSKTIELSPRYTLYYEKRAELYMEMKQYDKAVADWTKVIEFEPKSYNYYNRGKCYEALGETAKAQADFAKAEELRK